MPYLVEYILSKLGFINQKTNNMQDKQAYIKKQARSKKQTRELQFYW